MTTNSEFIKTKIKEYEELIEKELKSSSRAWDSIIYWKLCIIDLRLQEKL